MCRKIGRRVYCLAWSRRRGYFWIPSDLRGAAKRRYFDRGRGRNSLRLGELAAAYDAANKR